MSVLKGLKPERVFKYFEEISAIPRGSENGEKIADYCVDFAKDHSLEYLRDNHNNVIIFKSASKGYEKKDSVILQGHLDMVCQKTADRDIDFLKDGLELCVDGDFVSARGTTLGADNGIAVSMILSILESSDIAHGPIEAVFTSDEEIGMIGATALDTSVLRSKRMINLDSEEMDCVTVSCAGGSDFKAVLPIKRKNSEGNRVKVKLGGLKGGHSGICINEGRVNANILAGRFLNHIGNICGFELIGINGGDKCNAITLECEIDLSVNDFDEFKTAAEEYLNVIKNEISAREGDFCYDIISCGEDLSAVVSLDDKNKIILSLLCAPNGVMEMSKEIEGLVETSLNLGILKTEENKVVFNFALRSNKKSALRFLEEKLFAYFNNAAFSCEVSGAYPPWEFNSDSELLEVYKKEYLAQFGEMPRVEAIHAGLECGVFADKISEFDGIAIGPQMYDVHTVNERLSVSSTEAVYCKGG